MSLLLAHGDLIPTSELGSAWETPPAVLAGAGLSLVLFGQAWIRLRRRGRADLAGIDRAMLFVAGVALGTLALVSPLDPIGEEYLLSAHMLEHVLIGDAAVALAIVAIRGPLTFFLLPGWVLRPLARVGPLRSFLRFLLRPKVSFAVWAAVMAGWHYPPAYDYVLDHQVVHDLQHVTFVIAGVLVWTQLVDPARRRELRRAGRIALAVALFACGQILADVLVFSFDPLYPAYAAQDERLLGLSPLADQSLAGIVMMAEQAVTLGTCVALLIVASHREVVAREAREQAARAA
ncbi:MAG TPA: cytochrome c oxidase assembly protein [Gaiellaceae bacterium]